MMALSTVRAAGASSGLVSAVAAPADRQCTIKIENNCSDYTLRNPRTYIVNRPCTKTLSATVEPSKSGSGLFIKTPPAERGCAGVFTYDLFNNSTYQCSEKMAVVFSNPYNFNAYSNMFAVGVFDMNKQCDYDLYEEMYFCAEDRFVRGEAKCGDLIYESEAVTIRANMSDSYHPAIKIQLCNS